MSEYEVQDNFTSIGKSIYVLIPRKIRDYLDLDEDSVYKMSCEGKNKIILDIIKK